MVTQLLSPAPGQLALADGVPDLAVSSVVLTRITKQGWKWPRGARLYTERPRRAIANSSACRHVLTVTSSNRDPKARTRQMGPTLRSRTLTDATCLSCRQARIARAEVPGVYLKSSTAAWHVCTSFYGGGGFMGSLGDQHAGQKYRRECECNHTLHGSSSYYCF